MPAGRLPWRLEVCSRITLASTGSESVAWTGMGTKKRVRKAASQPARPAVRKALPSVASKVKAKRAKPTVGKPPAGRPGLAEVMRKLEAAGSESTRKTWARHGATGPMFGVLFGELFKLMKAIDVDQDLARELWATGNVDARNLAMKIADPQQITPAELDRWAIENPLRICGLYIATLTAEGPHAQAKLRQWLGSADERLLAMGWTLLGRLADLDAGFPEDELQRRVAEIEQQIHTAPNIVRSEMNRALITIGGRSAALRKVVTAAAKRIGTVAVDQGDTSCKIPDALVTLDKMWARSAARFGSPAAHERSMPSMRRRC